MNESVVLYSTGCVQCKVLKEKLQAANIEFTEINDTGLMRLRGITSVPVLQIGDEMLNLSAAAKWIKNRSEK